MLPPMDVMGLGRMAIIADPRGIVGLWQAADAGFARHSEPGAVTWCNDDGRRNARGRTLCRRWACRAWRRTWAGHATSCSARRRAHGGHHDEDAGDGPMPNVWGVYFGLRTRTRRSRGHRVWVRLLQPPTDITPGRFAMIADPQGAIRIIARTDVAVD
jgi:hypothetical protein